MSPTDCVGVSWQGLIDRTALVDRLAGWARAEPVLAGFASLDEVACLVHRSADHGRADEVFGALVRLAAVDGGDDSDAALLVAHLLANGTRQLALQLRDLSEDIDGLIAGQLWLQIRCFPWRHRTRAYAKSLLLDTRLAVMAELRPYLSRAGDARIVLRDPMLAAIDRGSSPFRLSRRCIPHEHDGDEPRLVDVLEWAQRTGTVSRADVALLLELVAAGHALDDGSGMARRGVNTTAEVQAVASRHRVVTKTIRRRRDRALAALREVSADYLAAIA